MMTKKVKYPKKLGTTEITLRNKHLCRDIQVEECLWDDFGINTTDGQLSRDQIETLGKSAFELSGAFPYLFDVINWVCTLNPDKISRVNTPGETHYKVEIPWEVFFRAALGKYNTGLNKKRLYNELLKLFGKPPVKIVPLNDSMSIATQLIRASIVYDKKTPQPARHNNLKHGKGLAIKGIILEFYKPIWTPLLKGKYGEAWFLTPKAFTARIYYAIERYAELPEFKRFGNFGTSLNYRRLFVYMNMHDNGKGQKTHYDALDLARSCLPAQVYVDSNGQYKLRSWFELWKFFKKAMLLLNQMARDGIMDNLGVIPSSVWFDKGRSLLSIDVCRNHAQVPELTIKDDHCIA